MTILFMKKKYQLERFFVTWLMILFMILTDAFTAFAQVKQATFLVNGISCDLEQGILKVEFVTPDVVRVQYTGENTFIGNGTDVCLPRAVDNPVRWVYTPNPDCYLLKSDSLIVRVDLSTASITYLDKEGGIIIAGRSKYTSNQ